MFYLSRFLAAFFLLTGVLAAQPCLVPTTVVVLRHAEKDQNHPSDPDLTLLGKERAESLVHHLQDSEVKGLFATPFKRTQQTLAPLADKFKLAIQTHEVNKTNWDTFAETLRQQIQAHQCGGTAVVAHHSNTIPILAKGWAGLEIPNLQEDEYNRLFIFVLPRTGRGTLIRANF